LTREMITARNWKVSLPKGREQRLKIVAIYW